MSFINQYRSTTVFGELKVQKFNTGNIAGLLDVSGNALFRGDVGVNGNLYATDGTVDLSGNLTVSGNITGTSSNVNVTQVGTNSSFRVPFLSGNTGSQTISSNGGISYNPSTETLSVTNINGTVTSNSATSTIETDSSDDTFFPIFVSGTTGNLPLKVDSGLVYNPSTNLLTLTGDADINLLTIGRGGGNIDTNTALGQLSLASNTTGEDNTSVGYFVLEANTTGNQITAMGFRALVTNTSGAANTAVGFEALVANITGSNNVSVGGSSMTDNIEGSSNVAVGFDALDQNTTGSFNVGIGDGAGRINKTGSNNTFLGYNTDISGNVVYNNSTALGTGSIIDQSNQIVIGTASENVLIRGSLTVSGNVTGNLTGNVTGNVTGNLTGTASSVFATSVNTNASFRVPFLSGATGSQTISSDGGLTYNPSTNLLTTTTITTESLGAEYYSGQLAGVWLINGTNRTSVNSYIPLFCSQTSFANINNQGALTEVSVSGAVVGSYVSNFSIDNTIESIILFPRWGIRGFDNTGYASTVRVNLHNDQATPIFVQPSSANVMSSCKIYYNKVEITGLGS